MAGTDLDQSLLVLFRIATNSLCPLTGTRNRNVCAKQTSRLKFWAQCISHCKIMTRAWILVRNFVPHAALWVAMSCLSQLRGKTVPYVVDSIVAMFNASECTATEWIAASEFSVQLELCHYIIHTYIHTHTYINTYIHIYIHAYIHIYIHKYTYIYTYINTYLHIYIHTHINTYIHISIHVYIHIYINNTYVYTFINTYIYTYIYIHKYIHTYIRTRIHIYIYIHKYILTYIHTRIHIYIYIYIT